jgi:PAS domain S-box-containing protein
MTVQSPELAALAKDPALAPFIRDGVAVIVWASKGGGVLWASEAAREFVESVAPGGQLPENSPLRGRLDVLASGLAPRRGVKLERLRLSPEAGAEVLTCACHILSLPSDDSALLTAVIGRVPGVVRSVNDEHDKIDADHHVALTKSDHASVSSDLNGAAGTAFVQMPLMTGTIESQSRPGTSMAAIAATLNAPMPVRQVPSKIMAPPLSDSSAIAHVRQFMEQRKRIRFVWETDAEGRFTRISPDLAEALGAGSAEVLGQTWWDLIGQRVIDPLGQVAESFEQHMTWTARDVPWRIEDTDGAVLVDMSAAPLGDASGHFAGFRGFGICRLDTLRQFGMMAAGSIPAIAPAVVAHQPQSTVIAAVSMDKVPEPERDLVEPEAASKSQPDSASLQVPARNKIRASATIANNVYHQRARANITPLGWRPQLLKSLSNLTGMARLQAQAEFLIGSHGSDGIGRFSPALHASLGKRLAKIGRGTIGAIGKAPFIADKPAKATSPAKTTPPNEPVENNAVSSQPEPSIPNKVGAESQQPVNQPQVGEAITPPAPVLATTPPAGKVAVRVPGLLMPIRRAGVDELASKTDLQTQNGAASDNSSQLLSILQNGLGVTNTSFNSRSQMSRSSMAAGARFPSRVAPAPQSDDPHPAQAAKQLPVQAREPQAVKPEPFANPPAAIAAVMARLSKPGANNQQVAQSQPAPQELESQQAPLSQVEAKQPPSQEVATAPTKALSQPTPAKKGLSNKERASLREIARALGEKRVNGDKSQLDDSEEHHADVAPQTSSDGSLAPGAILSAEPDNTKQSEITSHKTAAQTLEQSVPVQSVPVLEQQAEPLVEPASAASSMSDEDQDVSTQNERLASLIDDVPVPIVVYSDQDILYANTAFLELILASDLEEVEENGGIASLLYGSVKSGPNKGAPLAIVDLQGTTLPISAKITRVMWGDELATMVTIESARENDNQSAQIAKDMAKDLDHKAKQNRIDELSSILDTATDGVAVIDHNGRLISLNSSAEALFGYEQSEVAGESFTILLASESHPAALDYLDGLKSNGVASIMNDGRDIVGRARQGGNIPLFMTLGRISDHQGEEKFCAVLRDMTAWKKAEGELVEARRSAERASSQKSDFLAKMSHEIRTPLNAIIGFAEVMLEERFGAISNDRYKDYLRDIHASGGHVISLVNDLLDLAKIEAGRVDMNFTGVDVNDLAANCVSLLLPQANRDRIVLRTSLTPKLPPVVADERSLRQVMLNILSNAVKFTDSGGQVIVSTAITEKGEIAIRVRDTGIGMSEPEVRAALEPFRQLATSRRSGGTGLGLPLTKAMVEANRGQFLISSAKGEGTLIEVLFPPTRVLAS